VLPGERHLEGLGRIGGSEVHHALRLLAGLQAGLRLGEVIVEEIGLSRAVVALDDLGAVQIELGALVARVAG
jgi:hypothetical protein